jgi:hypothetical protein
VTWAHARCTEASRRRHRPPLRHQVPLDTAELTQSAAAAQTSYRPCPGPILHAPDDAQGRRDRRACSRAHTRPLGPLHTCTCMASCTQRSVPLALHPSRPDTPRTVSHAPELNPTIPQPKQCATDLAHRSARLSSRCRSRNTASLAQSAPSKSTLHRDHPDRIRPLDPSGNLPCCSFAPSPHLLSPLSSGNEAHHFPGQQSPRNLTGARVDGEAVGRRRPPLPVLLLHHSLPLLGLELTLRPIPCLAEQGCRHHRWNPKVTVDEHGRAPHLELFFMQDLDVEEFRSHRRHPAATQPPSTPLGEPRLRAYSS